MPCRRSSFWHSRAGRRGGCQRAWITAPSARCPRSRARSWPRCALGRLHAILSCAVYFQARLPAWSGLAGLRVLCWCRSDRTTLEGVQGNAASILQTCSSCGCEYSPQFWAAAGHCDLSSAKYLEGRIVQVWILRLCAGAAGRSGAGSEDRRRESCRHRRPDDSPGGGEARARRRRQAAVKPAAARGARGRGRRCYLRLGCLGLLALVTCVAFTSGYPGCAYFRVLKPKERGGVVAMSQCSGHAAVLAPVI